MYLQSSCIVVVLDNLQYTYFLLVNKKPLLVLAQERTCSYAHPLTVGLVEGTAERLVSK